MFWAAKSIIFLSTGPQQQKPIASRYINWFNCKNKGHFICCVGTKIFSNRGSTKGTPNVMPNNKYFDSNVDSIEKLIIRFLAHSSGDGAINGRFFLIQVKILIYCGLWNPFEAPCALQPNKKSSKIYAIVSVAVLAFFYGGSSLGELVYIIKLDDFKVFDVRIFVTHANLLIKRLENCRMFRRLSS